MGEGGPGLNRGPSDYKAEGLDVTLWGRPLGVPVIRGHAGQEAGHGRGRRRCC